MEEGILQEFQNKSTWRLVILSIVTLGIYPAFYVHAQTKILNSYLASENRISETMTKLLIMYCFILLVVFIPYVFTDKFDDYELWIIDIPNIIYYIWFVYWAIKFRRRINYLLNLDEENSLRFKKVWSWFFTPYYFNYKLNCLKKIKQRP